MPTAADWASSMAQGALARVAALEKLVRSLQARVLRLEHNQHNRRG
jgi:hypothetical protein